MTALSPLRPLARLIRLSDNTVRATTTQLLGGTGRSSVLDAAGSCSVVVPLSDPGDANAFGISTGKLGFAATLLQGGGGAGESTPVPMLLSLSLDGGATWDTHRLVMKPLRPMDPQMLTLSESGEDIFTLYSQTTAAGGHGTPVGCALADVLGAAPGSIIPLAAYRGFIAADHKLPFVCGLFYPTASIFQDIPGNTAWNAGALARLAFTAVLPTTGFTTPTDLAFSLPTTEDTWSDNIQHALLVIIERLGGVVLSGDTAPLGSRGHYVADCSDAALNVARTFAGVVCDGTPTLASPGGANGLSNARPAPPAAPTLSAVTATSPGAGTWTVALSYGTGVGETLPGPTATITVTGSQAPQVAGFSGIPASVNSLFYYMSTTVGGATLGRAGFQAVIAGAVSAQTLSGAGTGTTPPPTLDTTPTVARSVVIGSVGAPSGLTFTGDLPAGTILDETTTADILPGATIEPDVTVLHGIASFEGGSSDAGFPAGGTITALTQLNRSPGGGRDAFTDCLPLLGITVSDTAGGVYYYDCMGTLVPLNNSQSIPVLDLCVDTVNNVINIATPHGVYHRTTDLANTTDAWVAVGGLTARVVRLSLVILGGVAYLYAFVQDPQNTALDGIYQYHPSTAISGLGYNGWVRAWGSSTILDFVSTDDHTFFYLDKTDQTKVFLRDFTASPPTTTALSLPAGVNALRLDRVTGASTDTVYVTTTGDTQAAYYTKYTSSWQPLVAAQLAVGANLKVNRFIGPNVAINIGASAVTVQAMAATDDGLYFATTPTPTSPSDWTSANDQNGLGGIAITNAMAGAYQTILGQNTSRMFACTASDLYMSGNSGVQFDDVTRGRVDLGPYLKALVVSATGAPPTNSVQTVGPMASSPLGLASSTHVQVATYLGFATLPATWYYLRRLTQRGMWEYRLVNPDCPYSAMKRDQFTDIQANETVAAGTASAILAATTRKWLGENSTTQTVLRIMSSFTQTNAALRMLQPGQAVSVTMNGDILQRSSSGDIIDTVYVAFSAKTFYVRRHDWVLPQDGAGYADTTTELTTVLRSSPPSGADIAADLQNQLRDLKVWTAGKRRR